MSDVWVVNASPVIALGAAGYIQLLDELAGDVLLPEPVAAEILAGPESDPARKIVQSGWGRRVPCENFPGDLLEWGLGQGETSVLAIARERSCFAVLDDAAARSCAKAIGIPVIGTLGIVLRAKKCGLLSNAADVLRTIVSAGFYLDDHTIRTVLASVAETW